MSMEININSNSTIMPEYISFLFLDLETAINQMPKGLRKSYFKVRWKTCKLHKETNKKSYREREIPQILFCYFFSLLPTNQQSSVIVPTICQVKNQRHEAETKEACVTDNLSVLISAHRIGNFLTSIMRRRGKMHCWTKIFISIYFFSVRSRFGTLLFYALIRVGSLWDTKRFGTKEMFLLFIPIMDMQQGKYFVRRTTICQVLVIILFQY